MVHLVIGLILAALGIWGVIAWWAWFGLVMRGVVPFCLLLFGLLAILSGCRREGNDGACAVPAGGPDPGEGGHGGRASPRAQR